MGQWRYYPLTEDMNPKTVDWKMFLGTEFGLAPDQPFNRAKYAQWRCYWDFGGGMYTDLFVHQLTHLILAMGVRFPRRVVGAGGLYLEYDGRDVPDVATVVADYDEGCQVIISATMCNDVQLGEVIRGHTGDDHVRRRPSDGFRVVPQKLEGRPAPPGAEPGRGRRASRQARRSRDDDTRALWEHFIECVRSRNPETLCPAELGYAAIATVNLGVAVLPRGQGLLLRQGDRQGLRGRRRRGPASGRSGASERGKPNQVIGWKAGDEGSLLDAARLPEARRRLGRRQGPRRDGLSRLPIALEHRHATALGTRPGRGRSRFRPRSLVREAISDSAAVSRRTASRRSSGHRRRSAARAKPTSAPRRRRKTTRLAGSPGRESRARAGRGAGRGCA